MIVSRQLPFFATVSVEESPPPKMTGSISKCSCSFRSLSKIVRKMGGSLGVVVPVATRPRLALVLV